MRETLDNRAAWSVYPCGLFSVGRTDKARKKQRKHFKHHPHKTLWRRDRNRGLRMRALQEGKILTLANRKQETIAQRYSAVAVLVVLDSITSPKSLPAPHTLMPHPGHLAIVLFLTSTRGDLAEGEARRCPRFPFLPRNKTPCV
ncbi:hypothetical protein RRG08_036581 [Elysia crispata]|uniref:Uncharacterized protein n=1 Tax=Elysia crispata TaxID=231223 RepID=A0AAE0ZS03_9GAST|nr:hypothetical protein RRG08_036581 [Elysia crispata]